ncbi:hypothetical protein AK830_g7098 [Neonectria ditissima]|uniref:Uncharacterized protein n=1 Tax=Neonectria ditissima TaxID=78410 RepID=A0A0P7BFY0_9HYPO|nr:hypothetical protein AK830_g7098 [Neonectria ditissima]
MEEFFGQAIPEYAVLSHTWAEQEVSFDDWQRPEFAETKKGYGKILGTCKFASKIDGLKHVWVDTACIDKRSSADLSEAINSMFRWYSGAQVCLVHLADVDAPEPPVAASPRDVLTGRAGPEAAALTDDVRRQFRESRWFTRGWTLQELLAPRYLLFLSKDWSLLGNLQWLVEDIGTATGIPERIAQRMSWAAGRETTRIKDMAYCLMGLFNISMPLLYGEGTRAFRRLQAEIIRESYDHSIFAWQGDGELDAAGDANYPILAPSPRCFREHSRVIQAWDHNERSHYTLTNSGLRITLPVLKTVTPGLILAVLNCRWSTRSSKDRVCLALYSTSGDRYTRLASIPVKLASAAGVLPGTRKKMYVTSPDSLDMGDISSWAAFAMLWSPTAMGAPEHHPPSTFLAFEGGPDQPPPRYLEPRLGWRRLLCPWTRPGLMELCAAGPATYAAILEFTDPQTSKKVCVVIGRRPREDGDLSTGRNGSGNDVDEPLWFTYMMKRGPLPDKTFEDVFKWAGAGETDLAKPGQQPGAKPYAEIQFPAWGAKMQWVPAGCPMVIIRTDQIFAKARTRPRREDESE